MVFFAHSVTKPICIHMKCVEIVTCSVIWELCRFLEGDYIIKLCADYATPELQETSVMQYVVISLKCYIICTVVLLFAIWYWVEVLSYSGDFSGDSPEFYDFRLLNNLRTHHVSYQCLSLFGLLCNLFVCLAIFICYSRISYHTCSMPYSCSGI